MEKLTAEQQADVKKMSSEQLYSRLARIGVEEDELMAMDRAALLNAWAVHLLSGKPVPTTAAAVEKPLAIWEQELKLREQELALRREERDREEHVGPRNWHSESRSLPLEGRKENWKTVGGLRRENGRSGLGLKRENGRSGLGPRRRRSKGLGGKKRKN